jgi:hypothetical protein
MAARSHPTYSAPVVAPNHERLATRDNFSKEAVALGRFTTVHRAGTMQPMNDVRPHASIAGHGSNALSG